MNLSSTRHHDRVGEKRTEDRGRLSGLGKSRRKRGGGSGGGGGGWPNSQKARAH